MSKTFRAWDVEQRWLLPPSVDDLVPADHLAHLVRETVRQELDLSAILSTYTEERGYPPYHPAMMVALLLYAYSRGVYSSRRIAQGCEERVDFMAVTALNRPDFRTIATFRQRHLKALGDLFVQILKLCRAAGLVKLGHVALDGTKLQANASVHKAMSYRRMREAERKLAGEVAQWFARAEASDRDEDRVHGADKRGDEMPAWVADKAARLERIRAAKAALEAEAKRPAPDDDDGPGPSSGMGKKGRPQRGRDGGPPDRAQRNFTDPDSRIQPIRRGFIQGYNAQIAVDGAHQIIVAQRLQTSAADRGALRPMLAALRRDLRANPKELSAEPATAMRTTSLIWLDGASTPSWPPAESVTTPLITPADGEPARARASTPWPSSCAAPDTAAGIASESRSSSPCSVRSNTPEVSDSSSSAASTRSATNGRSSAPPTISSSSPKQPGEPMPRYQNPSQSMQTHPIPAHTGTGS
jgi:transposase